MQLPRTITAVKQSDIQRRVSALIYGFPGAGKTYLARSIAADPKLLPAIIVVCDSGELTLKDLVNETDFIVVRGDLSSLSHVFNFLNSAKGTDIKTIFIDNLTELHRTAMQERAKISSQNKENRSEHEYTQNDYGVARNQILSVVGSFATKLPNHNVFATALAYNNQNELTNQTTIEVDLAGKLGVEVPGYFDLVGYLGVDTPKPSVIRAAEKAGKPAPQSQRVLIPYQTRQIPIARNRGGVFTEPIYDPNLSLIHDAMSR